MVNDRESRRTPKHRTELKLKAVSILRREMTQKEIARVLGVSVSLIGTWCKKYLADTESEIRSSKRVAHSQYTSIVRELYMDHHTYNEIAKKTGLSYGQVKHRISESTTVEERKRVQKEIAEIERKKRLAIIDLWLKPGETYNSVSRATGINKSTIHGLIHDPSLPYKTRTEVEIKFADMKRGKNQDHSPFIDNNSLPPRKGVPFTDLIAVPSIANANNDQQHAYAQAALAAIGIKNGFRVWIPKSDRKAVRAIVPDIQLIDIWPWNHVNEYTNRVVSNIDVIWFEPSNNVINSAYEVEHTTGIHPGLGRLKDIRLCSPNLHLGCYVVAPGSHAKKFKRQISREIYKGAAEFLTYEAIDSGKARFPTIL